MAFPFPTRSYFSLAQAPTPELLAEIASYEAQKAAKKAEKEKKKREELNDRIDWAEHFAWSLAHMEDTSPSSSTNQSTVLPLSPRERQQTPERKSNARSIESPLNSINLENSNHQTYPSEPRTPVNNTNTSWHSPPHLGLNSAMATTHRKDSDPNSALSPSDALHNLSTAPVGRGGLSYASTSTPSGPNTSQSPAAIYASVHTRCTERMRMLAAMKRMHQGNEYWLNTVQFTQADLLKLPSFQSLKLARRAANCLMLGISLPNVLEVKSSSPLEYLRTLYALLVEYESYVKIHPSDGSDSSSLSRARLPHMFRRTAHGVGVGKGRRTSSAADIGLPMSATAEPGDLSNVFSPGGGSSANGSATAGGNAASSVSFAPNEQELLKGEEYTYLLTPFLPFDPDFFEVFYTLADILIECYARIVTTVTTPEMCVNVPGLPGLGDWFFKVDKKIQKVMFQAAVKEFEDASKAAIKAEIGGLAKTVMGGLM